MNKFISSVLYINKVISYHEIIYIYILSNNDDLSLVCFLFSRTDLAIKKLEGNEKIFFFSPRKNSIVTLNKRLVFSHIFRSKKDIMKILICNFVAHFMIFSVN